MAPCIALEDKIKNLHKVIVRITGVLLFVTFNANSSSFDLERIATSELKWIKVADGVEFANLAGDENKTGIYAYRVKFKKGHIVEPHFHPDNRVITVISGSIWVGYGAKFEESTMKFLPAGSVWTEPKRQPHFTWAKGGDVILQVVGIGPSGRTAIDDK